MIVWEHAVLKEISCIDNDLGICACCITSCCIGICWCQIVLYCWWCIQMMFRRNYPFIVGNNWSTVVDFLCDCRGVKHPFSALLPSCQQSWNINNLPRSWLFPIIDIIGNFLSYKAMLTRPEPLPYKALRGYWPSRIAHYSGHYCLIIGFVDAIMDTLSSVEGQIV